MEELAFRCAWITDEQGVHLAPNCDIWKRLRDTAKEQVHNGFFDVLISVDAGRDTPDNLSVHPWVFGDLEDLLLLLGGRR